MDPRPPHHRLDDGGDAGARDGADRHAGVSGHDEPLQCRDLFDAVIFAVMGLAIVVQTLSTVAVAVALWRHRFADPALGWALRFGMTITIVGAMTGGLMTQPTRQQLDAARAGERMTIAGAHTVGAPDGGPGLPGTGWSTRTRRPARRAFPRSARVAGASDRRAGAGAPPRQRRDARPADDHRGRQLRRAVRRSCCRRHFADNRCSRQTR